MTSTVHAKLYDIAHVEPINWWVGMKHPELQIMVHVDAIADLVPEIHYPGVKRISVERTNNKNYTFIKIFISPHAKRGTLNLEFKHGKETITTSLYLLEKRQQDSAKRRGFDSHDAIYLIVPDRFSNVDISYDVQPGMSDITDRAQASTRHGGDIKGLQILN